LLNTSSPLSCILLLALSSVIPQHTTIHHYHKSTPVLAYHYSPVYFTYYITILILQLLMHYYYTNFHYSPHTTIHYLLCNSLLCIYQFTYKYLHLCISPFMLYNLISFLLPNPYSSFSFYYTYVIYHFKYSIPGICQIYTSVIISLYTNSCLYDVTISILCLALCPPFLPPVPISSCLLISSTTLNILLTFFLFLIFPDDYILPLQSLLLFESHCPTPNYKSLSDSSICQPLSTSWSSSWPSRSLLQPCAAK
jgi:hypothetical protein